MAKPPPPVRLADVHLVSEHLDKPSAAELEGLARDLGAKLPAGYRDYMRRFGRGEYCGVLSVWTPRKVVELRAAKSGMFAQAGSLWANFDRLLLESDKPRMVSLATSLDGDELCFHLDDPAMLFVFPRHRDDVFRATSFEGALAWFSGSGTYWRPTRKPWFESQVRRVSREFECRSGGLDADDLLDTLLGLKPDADDANDPPDTLFFRRAQAAVLRYDVGAVRLRVRCDETTVGFIQEVETHVRKAGWKVTPMKRPA